MNDPKAKKNRLSFIQQKTEKSLFSRESRMDSIDTLEVVPDPVSLMESMRAVGYTVEAAIADIIDNSLSASATSIEVRYDSSDDPFVAILDDGWGMSPDELTAAMRHGSSNPVDRRSVQDLGRFGLGLKTASLSQCRKLTVVSKKNGVVSARRWDLDVVIAQDKWVVVIPTLLELEELAMFKRLQQQESGTLIIWQDLDRLTAGSADTRREMTAKMAPVFEHLALVFHRFTQKEDGATAPIKLAINGLSIPNRDPFLIGKSRGQELEGQTIFHDRGKVSVLPYILPPVSELTPEEIDAAGGKEGLRGTQGFYIYRARRLVIWGTWFRLVPKEEFYKLARIRVDIPNTFDDLWALDIKKSAAYPPDSIRTRLRELIPHFANTSKRAVTYRGRRANRTKYIPIWNRYEPRPGTSRYEPNGDHPVIQSLSHALADSEQRHLQMILEILGAALPYDGIYADMCSDTHGAGEEEEILKELVDMAESLIEVTKMSVDRILEIDPLCRYPRLHSAIRQELKS